MGSCRLVRNVPDDSSVFDEPILKRFVLPAMVILASLVSSATLYATLAFSHGLKLEQKGCAANNLIQPGNSCKFV
jgi:hypothetical protein